MRVRKLKADELGTFQARWQSAADTYPVPMEYLERASVYGLFIDGAIRGGFTICTMPPYRYIEQLPEGARQRWQRELDSYQRVAEVHLAWLDGALRKSWRSLHFWLTLLAIARIDGDVLLAGASEERLAGLYQKALTLIVPSYEGPVTVDGSTQEREWVFMARRPSFRTVMKLMQLKRELRGRA